MDDESGSPKKPRLSPTRFFIRGLAISLPAILTLVILIWIANGVNDYIVAPTSKLVRFSIAKVNDESLPADADSIRLVRLPNGPPLDFVGRDYLVTSVLKNHFDEFIQQRRQGTRTQPSREQTAEAASDSPPDADSEVLSDEPTASLTGPELLDVMQVEEQVRSEWLELRANNSKLVDDGNPDVYVPLDRAVPYPVYATVAKRLSPAERPTSATGVYMEDAALRYFGSQFLLSAAAVSLIVVLLYFLGRFVNARIGGWMVGKVEADLLGRLPVVRNVYGSAKQVTEFLFSENQVEYRRVVAIEYPRRGIWSLGFVTGESMLDITAAVGEPCVSVLVPSSPMPVTGYTMCVPRSALLDLDITVDQAFQFCISCGVLVPPNQRVTPEVLRRELTRRLAERMRESGTDRRTIPALGNDVSSAGPSQTDFLSTPGTNDDAESD